MTSDAAQKPASKSNAAVPGIKIKPPQFHPDFATILGLLIAIGLIAGAIIMGRSDANFLNIPAFMIVVFGTMAATAVSFTGEELKHVPGILGQTIFRRVTEPGIMAKQLLDISTVARKRGVLALSGYEYEFNKDRFLSEATQLVIDGFSSEDIDRILGQQVDSLVERHYHAASIMRKASEIAPAMGLIGTLVGLVQMLSQLDDPATIGPAMAVALLTTFYGAILGTVILGPLSAKLDRNSQDEAMLKGLILTGMTSIAGQESPRRLEMLLNSALPPHQQIRYFD